MSLLLNEAGSLGARSVNMLPAKRLALGDWGHVAVAWASPGRAIELLRASPVP